MLVGFENIRASYGRIALCLTSYNFFFQTGWTCDNDGAWIFLIPSNTRLVHMYSRLERDKKKLVPSLFLYWWRQVSDQLTDGSTRRASSLFAPGPSPTKTPSSAATIPSCSTKFPEKNFDWNFGILFNTAISHCTSIEQLVVRKIVIKNQPSADLKLLPLIRFSNCFQATAAHFIDLQRY